MPQEKISRTFTSIQNDDFLRSYQNEISSSSIGNRQEENEPDYLKRANWAKTFKYEDNSKNEITYTIPLFSSKPEEFGNLIIVKNGANTNSYVINFLPEKKWLLTKKRRQGFVDFSGKIQLINLNGEVFSETNYEAGKLVPNVGNCQNSGW